LDLESIDARITEQLKRRDAVLLPPTVSGAWGRVSQAAG
jgi:hypothetical protein